MPKNGTPRTGNGSPRASKKPRREKTMPTREQVALRAYQIYQERGGAPGHELEDWTRAERELMQKNGKSRSKAEARSVAA